MDKTKQNNKRKLKTSTIPLLNKRNLENNHLGEISTYDMQKGIRLRLL
jgi:hypothetical protein